MSSYLLQPDPGGNCCPCPDRAGPCDDCGPAECPISVTFEAKIDGTEYFSGYVGSGLFTANRDHIVPIETGGNLVWRLLNNTPAPLGTTTLDIIPDQPTFFDNWHSFAFSIAWSDAEDNWIVTFSVDGSEQVSHWPVTGAPYDAGLYQVAHRSPDPFANVTFGAVFNAGGCTGPVDRRIRNIIYGWGDGQSFQFPPDSFDDFDAGRVTFAAGELHASHTSCFARAFYDPENPDLDSSHCCRFAWGQKATATFTGITVASDCFDLPECTITDVSRTFTDDVDDTTNLNKAHELFTFFGFGGDLTYVDGPWCIWEEGFSHEGGYINGHPCDDPETNSAFFNAFILGHDRRTSKWYLAAITLHEEGGPNALLIFAGRADNLADGFTNELTPGLTSLDPEWYSVLGGFLRFADDGSDVFPYSSCILLAIASGGTATVTLAAE